MDELRSRRHFVGLVGGVAGALVARPLAAGAAAGDPTALESIVPATGRSVVALTRGADRTRTVLEALLAIEDEIRPRLAGKRQVIIKPNLVSTVKQLASSHAEAIRGILEFLGPRFSGPIVIAESSAGNTREAFANFGFERLVREHGSQRVELLDLNEEGRYEKIGLLDADLHVVPVRLSARLLDPDAFVISAGVLKTHNAVVATLSVKNAALGAPLRSAPGASARWNDKRLYHAGVRQIHYNIMLTAQRMRPNWGLAVIDGHEGMEGNGPNSGTPVPSRLAIASTDWIAADRVGVEVMGIDASWLGYLRYCEQAGLGNYDLARIELRGESLAELRRSFQLHQDIERMLEWMGPMRDVPIKLGRRQPWGLDPDLAAV